MFLQKTYSRVFQNKKTLMATGTRHQAFLTARLKSASLIRYLHITDILSVTCRHGAGAIFYLVILAQLPSKHNVVFCRMFLFCFSLLISRCALAKKLFH